MLLEGVRSSQALREFMEAKVPGLGEVVLFGVEALGFKSMLNDMAMRQQSPTPNRAREGIGLNAPTAALAPLTPRQTLRQSATETGAGPHLIPLIAA